MKLIIFLIVLSLSKNTLASGCMSTGVKGSLPGWNKPALISSVSTSLAAFALSRESKISEEDKKRANYAYITPAVYFYLGVMFSCRTISLEAYNEILNKEKGNENLSGRKYIKRPTKSELEDSINRWRKMSKITLATVGTINLFSLYEIHQSAGKKSTKNIALASAVLTIVSAIYDYDNIFNNKTPPWANFNITTTEVGYKLLPSLQYTYTF